MFSWHEPPSVIRRISTNTKSIFLTFDDGPTAETTPHVLDLLEKHNAKATFFVIGKKADNLSHLITRMKTEGHVVLSHSIDHSYSNYFLSAKNIGQWMKNSMEHLQQLSGQAQHGFRPPAGVLNPPLLKASQDLQLPIILWNQRFFDSVFKLTPVKIQKRLHQLRAGDIVLLHDCQKKNNRTTFLNALELLMTSLKSEGFDFQAIDASKITFRH